MAGHRGGLRCRTQRRDRTPAAGGRSLTLNLDKTSWKHVTLGEVIRHVTDRVDPETSGLERFLAGEHIPSNSLEIREWGVIGQDPIGPMFYKRFQPGHVLYVSRRSYLRK